MPCQRLDATKTENISQAARLIRDGNLVAFPTETVYGLGALALNEKAVQKVYDAKGRPSYNPLIIHTYSAQKARELLKLESDELFWRLAKQYWPGPLTLVAHKNPKVPDLVTGGLDKVAVRVPNHPVALELLKQVGEPLVAPSANASGRPSSTQAEHVTLTLGDKIAAVLDAGPCEHGLESTVVDITQQPPRILRLGALDLSQFEFEKAQGTQGSPGRLDKHYAPLIPKIRWASLGEIAKAPENCGFLVYSTVIPAKAGIQKKLGATGLDASLRWHDNKTIRLPNNPAGYAQSLFAALYRLEQAGVQELWVEELPKDIKWDAVRDRLRRAMAG